MSFAQDERRALVDSMREVGPDALTLCAGWTTRDLAAHLVVRERRLDAAPGILIKPLAGYTEKVQASVAADTDWDALLADLASGPPIFSPMRPLDRWVNLAEMFIHHEDVLRGAADPDSEWVPRVLDPGLQDALRMPLRSMSKMTLRSMPAHVTLRGTDGSDLASGGSGDPVTVTGTPGELLLFATGRTPVTVTFDGDPGQIDEVKAAAHGF
ncbi:TIGR03085 family metal-binding protein [Gordonia polyisoprenivorans]|uniref:TIGR03085 family metal-binding protein n=1 Tax=Gordonia polyisoprenivorans TaxID=84595 RepID=UPI001AD752CB|nr:TIGR03085 family metal-binding protein [Gordonia polyisoprenivorans]QTI66899.1 TIGR03085 family protein [Gordonia polyisoprenivorans]